MRLIGIQTNSKKFGDITCNNDQKNMKRIIQINRKKHFKKMRRVQIIYKYLKYFIIFNYRRNFNVIAIIV